MPIPYRGRIIVGEGVGDVTINDLDATDWFGQVTPTAVLQNFGSGAVGVELLEGDYDGWIAQARVDTTGILRGDTPFARPRQ